MPTVNRPKRPWIKPRPATPNQGRTNPNRDVYDTTRWRRLRAQHLQMNPLCEHCLSENRLTDATVVDHIKPINEGGDPWDSGNFSSLCTSCHNSKSAKERWNKR